MSQWLAPVAEPALVSARLGILAVARVAHLGDQALPGTQAADQAAREGLIDVFEQPAHMTPGRSLAPSR